MRPARVAFDLTPVISGRTGIARYATQLGAALERHDTELRRFAIGRAAFPLPLGTTHVRVPARAIGRWWRFVRWPTIEQLIGGAELVHVTGPFTPATHAPLVVTIHDLAALRYPELHPPRHVDQQRRQLRMLAQAAAITTVSGATADDLIQLGLDAERIVVAPLGLTRLDGSARAIEGLEPGYLLTVGETSPRKGYGVLIEAMARLGGNRRLVMAGPPAADEQRLRSLAASLDVEDRITRLGPVDDPTLAGLYRGAVALCFPSIAEGFGLPVLEAMAAGLPVLGSDIAATHELAADAAVYPSCNDANAWADAIEGICSDARLRDRLGRAGRERAAEFTWDRTAAATLKAYRLALDAGS
jgi:glycosyltransferase involved in cell wall biosynthesis